MEEPKAHLQRPGRRRKRWIALLVGAGILAGLALYVVRFITAGPTLSHDYTAEYNALTRPAGYDPNRNAAPYYEKAFALLTEPPAGWPVPASFQPRRDPTGAQRRFLEPWVAANARALELVAQAAEKPYSWTECRSLYSDAPESILPCRWATLCLCYRAQLQAADGNMAGALRSVTLARRMARQLSRQGAQSRLLMGVALDSYSRTTLVSLLRDGPIAPDVLAGLQRELEALQPFDPPPFHQVIQIDRIRWLNSIQLYFTDNGRGGGHVVFKRLYEDSLRSARVQTERDEAVLYFRQLWLAWRHPGRKQTVQDMERLAQSLEELSAKTPWQLHQEGTSHDRRIREQVQGNYFLEIMVGGGYGRLVELCWQSQAANAALVAIVALHRYRQDKGVWPDSLEPLVKNGYLRQVPLDPYGDGPLVYRPAGATFVLYSLGRDFDDDGGTPGTTRNGQYNGDDVFWPLP